MSMKPSKQDEKRTVAYRGLTLQEHEKLGLLLEMLRYHAIYVYSSYTTKQQKKYGSATEMFQAVDHLKFYLGLQLKKQFSPNGLKHNKDYVSNIYEQGKKAEKIMRVKVVTQ